MGKPIIREFDQSKTILKFVDDYKGFAALISATGVTADANGRKIVKAGTPYPANDETCKGFLLHDVDVTQGDKEGTIVYDGSIVRARVTANGINVSADAEAAVPRVTFF